jgi:uncharacterized protein (DUF983 family)
VVGVALITEVLYQPPLWLHAVLWLPLILIVTRPMKMLDDRAAISPQAAEERFGGREP